MKPIRTLDEATQWLLLYAPEKLAEAEYRLDRMRRLMCHLGDPQESLRIVHVAGTSGKTSTCYFIRGLLEQAGVATGLTVSPHITAINERVQVGGKPLPEAVFIRYLTVFRRLINDFAERPSYYELTMAFAYWVFARERVAYAVIETGFGGLLDGSNVVVRPDKVCVINVIGHDHMQILGETLPEIARQKAGIMQPGNTAFVIEQDAAALDVITSYAVDRQVTLHVVRPQRVAALPVFHYGNWALAYATYEYLRQRDGLKKITASHISAAQADVPPGRYEQYRIGGKTIILDGAHNPQELTALHQSLLTDHIASATVICAFKMAEARSLHDKCEVITRFADHVILDSFTLGQDTKCIQSVIPGELQKIFERYDHANTQLATSHEDALDRALELPTEIIGITGSLYLVSHVRPLLLARQTID